MINTTFLIHSLLEGGFALQLILYPHTISFLSLSDDYASFVARSYGAALLGSAVTGFFSYSLPNMLPGKRVAAIGFMIYHALVALFCFQSRMDGPLTPTVSWALTGLHLFMLSCFYIWYKITADQVAQFVKQSRKQGSSSSKSH
ncbi:uncharacterized protein BX664DRAFT_329124 [Halteromyces radiatus]|uniref:uncharacterized protein n=1 Tax=Halteromyces radiatus TaxID=101107 RepID=UPI00221FCE2F|nr:uncharacterized protein BX664DRAFT_329124 [Halteromyces radiatus]KAI8093194.1 hypothetical protein BX664DRAFT_329124 [Halteromyces radiatus]